MGLKVLLDKCVKESDRKRLFFSLQTMAKGRGPHKLDAIKLLLAYLYGTPRQTMELSGDAASPLRVLIGYADNSSDSAAPASGATNDQAGA